MKFLFIIFSPIILSPASTKISLFSFLAPTFFYSFAIELTNDISLLVGRLKTSGGINSSEELCINPPHCTILDN